METMIGKVRVPVRYQRRAAVWHFTNGERRGDPGVYAFWTAVLKRPVNGRAYITARNLVGLEAGERFTRMADESRAKTIRKSDRLVYHQLWEEALKRGANVRYVRPSTTGEVEHWLFGHPGDADFGFDLRG